MPSGQERIASSRLASTFATRPEASYSGSTGLLPGLSAIQRKQDLSSSTGIDGRTPLGTGVLLTGAKSGTTAHAGLRHRLSRPSRSLQSSHEQPVATS